MANDQQIQGQIVAKEELVAVGFRWEGSYEQAAAGEIVALHDRMEKRQGEVGHRVDSEQILGVSHNREDGFSYTICVEVSQVDEVPEGMITVKVPAATYAKVSKTEEMSIREAYDRVWTFMKANGYEKNGLSEKDGRLSIVEIYPAQRMSGTGALTFDICVPLYTA